MAVMSTYEPAEALTDDSLRESAHCQTDDKSWAYFVARLLIGYG